MDQAKITRFSPPPFLPGNMFLEAEEEIEGGTSSSPVVDSNGRLVGIVSTTAMLIAGQYFSGWLTQAWPALEHALQYLFPIP
jgi:hypothetical protein